MSVSYFTFFTFGIAFAYSEHSCEEFPTVTIPQGILRGRRNVTQEKTEYYMFLRIPYASPPVGQLRFADPLPPEPWSGVRDATEFGSVCNQVNDSSIITGQEDCLFVNVFTPKPPCRNASHFPVMIWIHGGAFVSGSGHIYPGQLLDKNMVIVAVNYRLNIFGFLSLDRTDATGNAGLKDQSAALRWVQENIEHFGGDRHNVTIFGESAGGASVHYHLLSPMSAGLFHRAISQSGSALNPWAFTCRTDHLAFRLGYKLGRGTNNSRELVHELRATPAREITAALSTLLTAEESKRLLSSPFKPTLEYRRAGARPFLPRSPACLEHAGSYRDVPYVSGVNVNEAGLLTPEDVVSVPSYWQGINADLEQIVPLSLGLENGSRLSSEAAVKIKEFYFGNESISYENRDRWRALQSDLLIITGVHETLVSHARSSDTAETYCYHFVFNNATHTDDLTYLFYPKKIRGQNNSEAVVANIFGSLWSSFAKTGKPAIENDFYWKPVRKEVFNVLELSTNVTMKTGLEEDRMNFWTNIYRKYQHSRRYYYSSQEKDELQSKIQAYMYWYPCDWGDEYRPTILTKAEHKRVQYMLMCTQQTVAPSHCHAKILTLSNAFINVCNVLGYAQLVRATQGGSGRFVTQINMKGSEHKFCQIRRLFQ